MQNNTTSLSLASVINGALATVAASNVAAGSRPAHVKGPGRIKSHEAEQTHFREKRESNVVIDTSLSDSLRCRTLKKIKPALKYNTPLPGREQAARDYPGAHERLALGLNQLLNNVSSVSCPKSRRLISKNLEGLEAALINRQEMLIEGSRYRPCIVKGKKNLHTEGKQKQDLVARINEFGDLSSQCSGAKASLSPSERMMKRSPSTSVVSKFSKGKERMLIIDQLEKINNARQAIHQTEPISLNRRGDCQKMGVVQYPASLQRLIHEKGWQLATQIAYQSLRDDLTVITRALKHDGSNMRLQHLHTQLGTLKAALTTREKYLTYGKFFQPCTTESGQPLLATNQELGEYVAFLAHDIAKQRDHLLTQQRGLSGSDPYSAEDAFFRRTVTRAPGNWKESRQLIPLRGQIDKLESLIEKRIAASEVSNTDQPVTTTHSTPEKGSPGGRSSLDSLADIEDTGRSSFAGEGEVRESQSSYFSNSGQSEVGWESRPVQTGDVSIDVPIKGDSDNICSPASYQMVGPFELTGELKTLVEQGDLQSFTLLAYDSLQTNMVDIKGMLEKVFSAELRAVDVDNKLQDLPAVLCNLHLALHQRLQLVGCTEGNVQSELGIDQQQRKDLIVLANRLAAVRDSMAPAHQSSSGDRSSVEDFLTSLSKSQPAEAGMLALDEENKRSLNLMVLVAEMLDQTGQGLARSAVGSEVIHCGIVHNLSGENIGTDASVPDGSPDVENPDKPSFDSLGMDSVYSYDFTSDGAEEGDVVTPAIVTRMPEVVGTSGPLSLCKQIIDDFQRAGQGQPVSDLQLNSDLEALVGQRGLQEVTQVAYESLPDDMVAISGTLKKVFSGTEDSSMQAKAVLNNMKNALADLDSALQKRMSFLPALAFYSTCTEEDAQSLSAIDNQQRRELVSRSYDVMSARDRLLEQHYGSLPGNGIDSSTETFFTRLPEMTPDWVKEAQQAGSLSRQVEALKKRIKGLLG